MIYEYRVYHLVPGGMAKEHERLSKIAFPLFEKHGMRVVGCWTNLIGGSSNEIIYMLGYADLAAREKSWSAFQVDPDWQKEITAAASSAPYVDRIDNVMLRPTAYSPMQ